MCNALYGRKEKKMGRYETGCKYCIICAVWIRIDENFCPCCRTQLRTKPRTRKGKERLRQIRSCPIPLLQQPSNLDNSKILSVLKPAGPGRMTVAASATILETPH